MPESLDGEMLDLIDTHRQGCPVDTRKLLDVLRGVATAPLIDQERQSDGLTEEQLDIVASLSIQEKEVLLRCVEAIAKMTKASIKIN